MSVLDSKRHQRLIADIDQIAADAGIPRRYIESSMTDICPDDQVNWVKRYPDHVGQGVYGLMVQGGDAPRQMMAMAGAFTRNFIHAKVVSLQTLLDRLREGSPPDPTVLMVPSFYRTGMSEFQKNLLWGCLEDRLLRDRLTVVEVQSIAQIKTEYGPHFADHLKNHFTRSGS